MKISSRKQICESGILPATMVVGVPLFAVLYSILSGLVCHSLRRRGMPEETQAYYELDHVDERTHDILYNEAPARPAAGSADRPE